MNSGLEYYRAFGQPASCYIDFEAGGSVIADGDLIVIQDYIEALTITYGTDFSGRNNYERAQNLAAFINADKTLAKVISTQINQPIRTYYAIYYGTGVRLISCIPGTAANDWNVILPASLGATQIYFEGGIDGGLNVQPSPTPTTAPTADLAQGAKTVVDHTIAYSIADVTTKVNTVEIWARKNKTTDNTGNVYIGFDASGSPSACLRALQPGETWVLSAPPGKVIDLTGIWVAADNDGDAVLFTRLN